MSLLTDFGPLATSATARRVTLDSDPASPTYGNEVTGTPFDVAYFQVSSSEVVRMGGTPGTNLYKILADFQADAAPVQRSDKLNLDGIGVLEVVAVIEHRTPDFVGVIVEAERRTQ